MELKNLRSVSFEIGVGCNCAHSFCPIVDPARHPLEEGRTPLHRVAIRDFVKVLYEKGFNGFIGWSIYNEPLMYRDRIEECTDCISRAFPQAKYSMITNGKLLSMSIQPFLRRFKSICITIYSKEDYEHVRRMIEGGLLAGIDVSIGYTQFVMTVDPIPGVSSFRTTPDERIQIYDVHKTARPDHRPTSGCMRPTLSDLPVTYYGEVRMCCADYRGSVKIGNILRDSHEHIIDRFIQVADAAARGGAHPICGNCAQLWNGPKM